MLPFHAEKMGIGFVDGLPQKLDLIVAIHSGLKIQPTQGQGRRIKGNRRDAGLTGLVFAKGIDDF